MVYDTNISVALKTSMSQYNIQTISLFRQDEISRLLSSVRINRNKFSSITFQVKCPICGKNHMFNYKISDIIKYEMTIGGCDFCGTPIFFMGKDNKIQAHIGKYEEVNKKIYAMI